MHASPKSSLRWLLLALVAWLAGQGALAGSEPPPPQPVPDTLAQRALACTGCHGPQGRSSPLGYVPRIAGKPEAYLLNQLLAFRDGRRAHDGMARLLQHLDEPYLAALAAHFAAQQVAYGEPPAATGDARSLALGQRLALRGDGARGLPACVRCHGAALTGVAPAVPGLLGLPRGYLVAQLGAWRTGVRRSAASDCMAGLAQGLRPEEIAALADWLAAQALPTDARPLARAAEPMPKDCGMQPRSTAGTPVAAAAAAAAAASASAAGGAPSAQVTRGAYLARVGNCAACHTARGGPAYAGGRGLATPFGMVYASNLTPDAATGLGRWRADDFWQALHQGRSRDGRLLAPAFPYTEFSLVNRADSDALWAYLQSLPPVVRPNQPHSLLWPFGTQAALWAWRTLYFQPQPFKPDPAQSLAWNRGAYLVRGLGHCAACHAPRNALGATQSPLALAGGQLPEQPWFAPPLAPTRPPSPGQPQGEALVQALKTGLWRHGSANGPMAEVVAGSTRFWTDDDLQAAALYLSSLPPVDRPVSRAVAAPALQRELGAALYTEHCAACHGAQGQGVAGAYPALAGNATVLSPYTGNLVQSLVHGGFTPVSRNNPRPYGMPPQALSDAELAAVLSHIRQAWGQQAPAVTEIEVRRQR